MVTSPDKKKVTFSSDHTYRYDPTDTPAVATRATTPPLFAKTLNMFVKQKGTQKDVMMPQQQNTSPQKLQNARPASSSPTRQNHIKVVQEEKYLQDEIHNQYLQTMSNKTFTNSASPSPPKQHYNRGLMVDTTSLTMQQRAISPQDGRLATHLLDKRRQKVAHLEQDRPKAKPIEQETIVGVRSKLEPKRVVTKSNLIEFLESKEVEQRVAASVVHQILLKEEEQQQLQDALTRKKQHSHEYEYQEPIFVHTEPKEDSGTVLSDYYETRPVSGGFKVRHGGSLKHGKMHAIRPPSRQEPTHENSSTAFIVNNQTLKPVIYFTKPVERPQTPLPADLNRANAQQQRSRAKTPPPPALTRDVSFANMKPPSTAPASYKDLVKLPARLAMDKSNLSHRMQQHILHGKYPATHSPYPTISTLSSVVIPPTTLNNSETIPTTTTEQPQQSWTAKIYKPHQAPMEKTYQPDLRKIVQQHLRPKSSSIKNSHLQPLLMQYEPLA